MGGFFAKPTPWEKNPTTGTVGHPLTVRFDSTSAHRHLTKVGLVTELNKKGLFKGPSAILMQVEGQQITFTPAVPGNYMVMCAQFCPVFWFFGIKLCLGGWAKSVVTVV